MLQEQGVPTSATSKAGVEERLLAVSIDRSRFSPCVFASMSTGRHESLFSHSRSFPFDYRAGFDESTVSRIAEHLQLPSASTATLSKLIHSLLKIFTDKEAFLLETRIVPDDEGKVQVQGARFGFDDAAFKSNRQKEVQQLRDVHDENPEEVEAEKDGIVYIRSVTLLVLLMKVTRLIGA